MQIQRLDSDTNLDQEPETQVYTKMTKFQGTKGVAHIITEILDDNDELDKIPDGQKHKFMKEMVGRKFSALESPTDSVRSSHSSKPFQSPKSKKANYFDQKEFNLLKEREYDSIEVHKFERNANDQFEQEFKGSAKKIISLLKKRDDYQSLGHSDWNQIDEIVTYFQITRDPVVDWSQHKQPLDILNEVETILVNGVYSVQQNGQWLLKVHSIVDFVKDLLLTIEIASDKVITSFCYSRNKYLEHKFKMHQIFNSDREAADQKKIKLRDFYNILKIDTHVHHSQSMCGQQLVDFMKSKFKQCPNEIVYIDTLLNLKMTLKDISEKFRFKPEELNLDLLDVQADKQLYKRFDRFTSKYSPLGQPMLRNIFLKSDNYIKGKYIAELTQEMFKSMNKNQYICAEYRITIYGKSMDEWHKKAQWLIKNNLTHPQVRWMIQIPRLYSVYVQQKVITCFQEMIDNIFKPLFDITINPTLDPDLYQALFTIVGFDCIDDETKHENFFLQHLKIQPKDWTKPTNPHYAYWIYYIYANLTSLNALRKMRGLNTFDFRPHCGEAGNIDHLACAYLLAQGISHGLVLEESPVLKYLYYLKQIGISMSPIANNKIVCKYSESPFNNYFRQGLNVCLSTDDPLMLHITDQPIMEEFAIAAQVFDLSNVDLAELANNSVRCSSFEGIIKEHYVGKNYDKLYQTINNPKTNNLPQSRFLFRQETLMEEFQFLKELSNKK